MSTRSFTNHGEQKLLRKFQGVFESNTDIEWFDALVDFLRASGYFPIRPFLGNVPHIRILVGNNIDGIMADYPLQQADGMPVTTAVAGPLDTAPDIILTLGTGRRKKWLSSKNQPATPFTLSSAGKGVAQKT